MSVTTAVADGLLRVPLSLPVLTFKKVQHKHVKTAILKNNYCQKNSNFFSKDSRIARDLGLPDSTWMLSALSAPGGKVSGKRVPQRGTAGGSPSWPRCRPENVQSKLGPSQSKRVLKEKESK